MLCTCTFNVYGHKLNFEEHLNAHEKKENNNLIKQRGVCDQSDKMKTSQDSINKYKVSMETV